MFKNAEIIFLWQGHPFVLHSLYRSPKIVRVIKSTRLRWAVHVARMEEGRNAFKILTGKPTGQLGSYLMEK